MTHYSPEDDQERRRRRRREDAVDAAAEGMAVSLPILFVVAGFVLLAVFALNAVANFIDALNPFNSTTEVAMTEVSEISLEPIRLDCYGRVTANVPVRMSRDTTVFGANVPGGGVDLEMSVVGKMITCVEEDASSIEENNGHHTVTVDARKVHFEPAAIDAAATVESIKVRTGALRSLADAIPFVNPDNELTGEGMTYAQVVVDQACASAAYELTQAAITNAYKTEQADALGIDPNDITVVFEGQPEPNRTQVPPSVFDGLTIDELSNGARCYPEPGATTQLAG